MLKNIKSLQNIQLLTKKEQQHINGRGISCAPSGVCKEYGWYCSEIKCQGLLGGPRTAN